MIRLYIENSLVNTQEIILGEAQSHYVQKVMRLKYGDNLLLFNGRDGEWKACIKAFLKKSTLLSPISQTRPQPQAEDLWLLFSSLKPKRQEFLVEKATELGISSLWPIRFERTSVPKINTEKMLSHSIEAAEQCGRLTIPHIHPLISLAHLLKNWPCDRVLLFGDESFSSPSLKTIELNSQQSYGFLVGPEGGFTTQERVLLTSHPQAQGVTLNPHILRAETAALAGIACLKLMA